MPGTRPGMTSQTPMPDFIDRFLSQTLRCALLRASKDEHGPWPILRGSLRSRLRMTRPALLPARDPAAIETR